MTRTPGRYYFSPPGTPFYGGVTLLGSKTWHDKNWGFLQGQGEALDTKIQFADGQAPETLPNAIQLGTSRCIAGDESADHLLSGVAVFNGFPTGCFRSSSPQSLTWEKASSYDSCSIQAAWAQIIDWVYAAAVPSINAFLAEFLGPAWVLTWHQGAGSIPNMQTAVSPYGAIIWIAGTDNFQQLALQASDLVELPRDVGIFATSQFWYDCSDSVIQALNVAAAPPAGPVFLCGHSFGGIIGCLAAARFRMAQRDRPVRWLTYGMPKIGDVRIVSTLGTCPGRALSNDTDIVAAFAPDLVDVLPATIALVAPQFLVWPAWRAAPYQWRQDAAGIVTAGATPILDTAIIIQFMTEILASLPHATYVGHLLATYIERIRARCPDEEWPLKDGDYTELFGDVFIVQEDESKILQESSSAILIE